MDLNYTLRTLPRIAVAALLLICSTLLQAQGTVETANDNINGKDAAKLNIDEQGLGMKLFPNPFRNEVNLVLPNARHRTIHVDFMNPHTGVTTQYTVALSTQMVINTAQLGAGTYFVKVKGSDGTPYGDMKMFKDRD